MRHSPGATIGIEKTVITGKPDPAKICTSFVERQNLTLRMLIRRMTSLTNAHSKKLRNRKAAISLHVAYYNLCRVHETLRITPAMAVGVTGHVWSLAELVDAAKLVDGENPLTPIAPPLMPAPTLPRDPETGLLAGRQPFKVADHPWWEDRIEAAGAAVESPTVPRRSHLNRRGHHKPMGESKWLRILAISLSLQPKGDKD